VCVRASSQTEGRHEAGGCGGGRPLRRPPSGGGRPAPGRRRARRGPGAGPRPGIVPLLLPCALLRIGGPPRCAAGVRARAACGRAPHRRGHPAGRRMWLPHLPAAAPQAGSPPAPCRGRCMWLWWRAHLPVPRRAGRGQPSAAPTRTLYGPPGRPAPPASSAVGDAQPPPQPARGPSSSTDPARVLAATQRLASSPGLGPKDPMQIDLLLAAGLACMRAEPGGFSPGQAARFVAAAAALAGTDDGGGGLHLPPGWGVAALDGLKVGPVEAGRVAGGAQYLVAATAAAAATAGAAAIGITAPAAAVLLIDSTTWATSPAQHCQHTMAKVRRSPRLKAKLPCPGPPCTALLPRASLPPSPPAHPPSPPPPPPPKGRMGGMDGGDVAAAARGAARLGLRDAGLAGMALAQVRTAPLFLSPCASVCTKPNIT
jgi:hypothetical protein